ncbi:DMT family transporter [Marichromatium sp. PS1]|uniref:DMT family transporter n=1 Tax=Marichromatium sp. PS1 TaxID=3138932 RepID=UPI0034E8B68C
MRPTGSVEMVGLGAALVTPVAWGLTGVFVRLLPDLPATVIVVARLGVGLLVLAPFLLIHRRQAVHALRPPLPLAMGLYYVLATEAFVRAPVVEVTLVIGAAPVIAVLLQWVGGAAPSGRQLGCVALALAGLALYLAPALDAGSLGVGHGLAFGCALVAALYAIGVRRRALAGGCPHPLALTAVACLWGLVVSLPWLWAAAPRWPVAGELPVILALALVSTVLPTLSYGIAAARLSPLISTTLGLLTPLVAALAAVAVLGEWPHPASLPGAVMTLAGLFLLVRTPARG